jgi:hypothetical protein
MSSMQIWLIHIKWHHWRGHDFLLRIATQFTLAVSKWAIGHIVKILVGDQPILIDGT